MCITTVICGCPLRDRAQSHGTVSLVWFNTKDIQYFYKIMIIIVTCFSFTKPVYGTTKEVLRR